MRLKFIGTSSGKTEKTSFHSSILIYDESFNMLIDAGDGISKALLSSNINLNSIDVILISHFHADHISGITSFLTQAKILKRIRPLKIYCPAELVIALERILNYSYLFNEKYDFDFDILGFNFDDKIKLRDNLEFVARQNSHIVKKVGINNKNDVKFISASFLLNIDGMNIFYTSDIGTKEDLKIFNDYKINFVISEASHVEIDSIIEIMSDILPNNLYLTHYNSDEFKHIGEVLANSKYEGPIKIANDGLEIDLID